MQAPEGILLMHAPARPSEGLHKNQLQFCTCASGKERCNRQSDGVAPSREGWSSCYSRLRKGRTRVRMHAHEEYSDAKGSGTNSDCSHVERLGAPLELFLLTENGALPAMVGN